MNLQETHSGRLPAIDNIPWTYRAGQMVSSNMWTWVTDPSGWMIPVPNQGRQQEWKEAGKWHTDALMHTPPQTPDNMRTKKLMPWKLNGPFPKGFTSETSRACTPMVLSPQGSRMGSRMGTAMADSRPRTTQDVNLNATFQVRFPGDSSLYEFKSWDEVDKEFKRRGYDPRHANIHSNKSEARSQVQKDRSRILTSYGDMSTTIKQLASEGQSPYNSPYRALNNVRQVEDTLHFYGSVNGSPIPILKAAPRLPRSPPRSPSRSPTNLSTVAEELLDLLRDKPALKANLGSTPAKKNEYFASPSGGSSHALKPYKPKA